jgi:thiol-disulfide isomerase/thioredoxin
MLIPALLIVSTWLPVSHAGPRKAQTAALEARVAELEGRMAALEAAAQRAPVKPSATEEAKAAELLTKIEDAIGEGEIDEAVRLIDELNSQYGETRAAARAARIGHELSVIGKRLPQDWREHVSLWFHDAPEPDLDRGVVLLVFWEAWCPHCKRELPRLAEQQRKHEVDGLQVVGMTKVTRSSTLETTSAFLSENDIAFPNAKVDGALSDLFAISGIPAMVVLKDGEAIWRGHPAKVNETLLEEWLGTTPGLQ